MDSQSHDALPPMLEDWLCLSMMVAEHCSQNVPVIAAVDLGPQEHLLPLHSPFESAVEMDKWLRLLLLLGGELFFWIRLEPAWKKSHDLLFALVSCPVWT
mmetsp:Transcript_8500/g.24459  ORF Transcript_8500/g.24459 Transcript_8500/m.24459 type:complete len:100 (-) Transcript_8500:45-344(-)